MILRYLRFIEEGDIMKEYDLDLFINSLENIGKDKKNKYSSYDLIPNEQLGICQNIDNVHRFLGWTKKKDADNLIDDMNNVFSKIGVSLDTIFDDKKNKHQIVNSLFDVAGTIMRFLFTGTVYAVKNTPKAIISVVSIKRELTNSMVNEYQQYQKRIKEDTLNHKIKQLKLKKKS